MKHGEKVPAERSSESGPLHSEQKGRPTTTRCPCSHQFGPVTSPGDRGTKFSFERDQKSFRSRGSSSASSPADGSYLTFERGSAQATCWWPSDSSRWPLCSQELAERNSLHIPQMMRTPLLHDGSLCSISQQLIVSDERRLFGPDGFLSQWRFGHPSVSFSSPQRDALSRGSLKVEISTSVHTVIKLSIVSRHNTISALFLQTTDKFHKSNMKVSALSMIMHFILHVYVPVSVLGGAAAGGVVTSETTCDQIDWPTGSFPRPQGQFAQRFLLQKQVVWGVQLFVLHLNLIRY